MKCKTKEDTIRSSLDTMRGFTARQKLLKELWQLKKAQEVDAEKMAIGTGPANSKDTEPKGYE
jgi:hypothetical protein